MSLIRPQSGQKIPTGWFGLLYDEIVSNRIKGDGRTITAKRTPSGTVLSVIRSGKGGGSFSGGMFTIQGAGDGKFIIIDTNDPTQAGIAQINGSFYPVALHEFEASENVYVFLRYTLPTQDEEAPGDIVDFVESEELLQPDNEFAYGLIGRIIFANGQPAIAQDHTPGTLVIWWQGACWEAE